MTQYLLSVYIDKDEPQPPDDVIQARYAAVDVFNRKVQEAGAWVFAGGLQPADVATVVRVEGDRTLTTDGPYAETKEYMGGFWVIEASDLDAALEWAEQATGACEGPVEVRPFQD